MRLPSLRHVWLITRVELRRGLRKIAERGAAQLVALAVGGVFWLAFAVAGGVGGYFAGRALVAGEIADPLAVARYVPAAIATFLLVMTTYLAAVQLGDVDQRDGLLTTVPARDLAAAAMAVGYLRVVGIFAAPLVGAVVGFAAGTGSAATFLLLLVGVTAVSTAAFAVGYPLGIGLRYLLRRSAFVMRHKLAIGGALFLAYMAVVLTNSVAVVGEPAVRAVRDTPVGWFADLGLLAVAPGASVARAGAALAASLLVAVAGAAAAVRLSAVVWYADGAEPTTHEERGGVRAAWLERLFDRPTAWVVRKSWLRARRAPIKLLYVVYPLFAFVGAIQGALDAGRVTVFLAALTALYGAWTVGALFTLNPFGDEGAVLPVLLTTPVRGRQFVTGLLVADVVVGLPVASAVTLALGLLSPLSAAASVGLAAATAALCVGAPALAAGVGTAFPKFESTNVTRSRKVVVPSIWAFLVYSVGVLLLGGPGIAVQVPAVADAVAAAAGVSRTAVRAAGLLTTVALVGGAGALGFRSAVREFEDYTI